MLLSLYFSADPLFLSVATIRISVITTRLMHRIPGQCGSQSTCGKEMLSESKLRDLLHGSEYVVTYEDKDGDWMLVGDVPWE